MGMSSSNFRGLSNYGLSCCINALLQSFSATTELLDLLNSWQPTEADEAKGDWNIPLQLKKALKAMTNRQHRNPHQDFLDCLHRNNVRSCNQHDADEVFLSILKHIENQMSDQALANEVKNLYKITMDGHIQCSECKYDHIVPTHSLSFPLYLREDKNTFENSIRSFFELREIEGSNAFYCDRCGEKKPSTQEFRIVSLPPILSFNMKRFRIDRGYVRKLKSKVSFPESFSVAEIFPDKKGTDLDVRYRLYAVIVHCGSMAEFGHYTTFLCSEDQTWHSINDSYVSKASWSDVQKTYGGYETAYVLLYRKSAPETQQAPENEAQTT